MTERTSFNGDLSGKLLIAQISNKGMPEKTSNDCLKKLFCIYARIFTPMKQLLE